jgi:serine/threonine-protein kinase
MSEAGPRTRYCSRCLTTFVSDGERCPNLGCRSARPTAGWGELLDDGELIDRTYRVHRRLAIGGAGVTYLGRELAESGEEVGPLLAVKVLYQQRDQGPYLRRLATEAQILQGLNHPQIVECRGFVHRSGHSPYLVTRFEAGGSLLDHVRRVGVLPPRAAAGIATQVCDALAVAHRQSVIHRDLKPENVLLEAIVGRTDVPQVRVADFGIAKVFGGVGDRLTRVGAFIGTPQYAAPEQFDGMAPEPATDVYACGALLYFCLTARPVADFMGELDIEDQREHLVRHLPPVVKDVDAPEVPWINETLAAAMTPDPGDRMGIDVMAERLHNIALGKDPGRVVAPAALPSRSAVTVGDGPGALAADTISTHKKGPRPAVLSGQASAHAAPLPAVAPNATVSGGGGGQPAAAPAAADAAPSAVTANTSASRLPRKPTGGPKNTRTSERSGGRAAATTSVGCAALALLGASVSAMAAAGWWYLNEPLDLTGREPDSAVVADWQGIAYALGERGAAAERTCGTDPYLSIEVTVDGAGQVEKTRLLNYPHEPSRACIDRELRKTRFPRKGKERVRVAVQMVR